MSLISSATTAKLETPFVDDECLRLVTHEVDNKITGFTVTLKQKKITKHFPVKKFNILDAWKQVEIMLKDLK